MFKSSFNSANYHALTTAGARNATTFVYFDRSVCETEWTVIIALQKKFLKFDQTNLEKSLIPSRNPA